MGYYLRPILSEAARESQSDPIKEKNTVERVIFLIIALFLTTSQGVAAHERGADPDYAKQVKSLNAQAEQIKRDMKLLEEQIQDLKQEELRLESHQKALSAPQEGQLESPSLKETAHKKFIELGRLEGPEPDELFTPLPYGYRLLGNLGGTSVITSPYIHSRYEFRGSGLIANYSSINRDVAALRQRQNFEKRMNESGLHLPSYPMLELSGVVEGQVFNVRKFNGGRDSDINLTAAELDVQALINPWFTGFMSLNYDASPPLFGNRVTNSNVFIDNGFITLGSLNKAPLYATLGQVYVPFGQYSSYMISSPLIRGIFRTKARALVVGYQEPDTLGPYGSLFTFRGDSKNGVSKSNHINQFGGNLGYRFQWKQLHGALGTSYINNVADGQAMQLAFHGLPRFRGFSGANGSQDLEHRVPGADARVAFDYAGITWIGEYTTSLRSFDPMDLTFNDDGAKPSGFHTEVVYHFAIFERPSSLVLAYDKTRESLALGIPKERIGLGAGSAIWQNTLLSLQVTHSHHYGGNETASGSGGLIFGPPGNSSTGLIAQFDVYF